MSRQPPNILTLFTARRIFIPLLLGLLVVGYLFYSGFDKEAFLKIEWGWYSTFWIMMGLLMMVIRQVAYMYRIRVLTDGQLTWRKSSDVIFLWEFASAATPSIVGGTAFSVYLLNREKVNLGKSTAIALYTSFLDELFYIIFAPLFFILAGRRFMFPDTEAIDMFSVSTLTGMVYFFIAGYVALCIYTFLIGYGLFFNPRGLKRIIIGIFSLPFLRKWRYGALQTGNDVVVASKELQLKDWRYWAKAFGSTVVSWSARFFVTNCIILAFAPVDNHFIIYARQIVMWVVMLVTPTPGSSGMAEFAFSGFLVEFIPSGLSASLALLWRILSYYPYLFIGVLILPRWLKRVYKK